MSLDHEEKEFLKDMAQESPVPKARVCEAVPALGGEVEALISAGSHIEDGLQVFKVHVGEGQISELVNRAHVTRLQAEVASLIEARDSRVAERLAALDELAAERDALKAASDFNFKQAQENAEERDKVSAHRAEVIAERDALKAEVESLETLVGQVQELRLKTEGELAESQSELTKARELLNLMYWGNVREPTEADCVEIERQINAGLISQSAPADRLNK